MAKVRKAIAAAVLSLLAALAGALTAGHVSGPEVLAAVGAAIVAGLGVWAVPNAPQTTAPTMRARA